MPTGDRAYETPTTAARGSKKRARAAIRQHPRLRQLLDYERRLTAAGLPPHDDRDSINEFGRARRRAMWINAWHGCPLPVCRRQRGCMAPYLYCANRPPAAAARPAPGPGNPEAA